MNLDFCWETMFHDCSNPCAISDLETDQIVYMNTAMRTILRESEEFGDRKCFDILQGKEGQCSFCPNEKLTLGQVVETYVYNEKIEQFFRVTHTLLDYHGKKFNLCKYFVAPSFEEQQQDYEDAMHSCEKILELDPSEQLPSFLELLGNFYNAERVHTYRFDRKGMEIIYEAAWSHHDIELPDKLSRYISVDQVLDWYNKKNDFGIIEANAVLQDFTPNSIESEVLETFGLDNITLCHVGDSVKNPERMIGVSNRKQTEFDYRLLKVVSELVNQIGNPVAMSEIFEYVKDYDLLTGFFNHQSCSKQIDDVKEKMLDSLAIFYISLNHLQNSDKKFGSRNNIRNTKHCAQLLTTHFGTDFYRINSGDFIAFFENITEEECLERIKPLRKRLTDANVWPFTIGYAVHNGRIDVEEIISEASTITAINKQRYYHRVRHEENPSDNPLLNDLLRYLNEGELLVYLQPQVDMVTRQIIGAEALIRRYDKENKKMVFPDQFIPQYEHDCIIRHVDLFVLEKICELQVEWGKEHKQVPVSVNLSRVTLLEFDIVETIAEICDRHGVDHSLIIVEVTERVGLIENDVASSLIRDFQGNGFKISLDDFGCAYSNVVTLAKIEVNEVKIDKSLVDNITTSVRNQLLVGNIIQTCNAFDGTHTLAEGIETEEQATILQNFGCSYGQGYLFSRPLPHEEFFEKYIKNNN
ncbi:MAG: EAL domain-containing protein [Eubacteriales bacterium]